jgi:hypothetical protein
MVLRSVRHASIGVRGTLVVLAGTLLAGPALGQIAGPPAPRPEVETGPATGAAPAELPPGEVPPEEAEIAPLDPEKPQDPRAIAAEELARQERILRTTETIRKLPLESDVLSTTSLPRGLIPKRGLRAGQFLFLPTVNAGAVFSDNVDADSDEREQDLLLGAASTVRAQALLSRHEFGVEASATGAYAVEGTEDDVFAWRVGADGRLELSRFSSFNAAVDASLGQEADSSAEAEGSGDDAELNAYGGNLGYQLRGRRFDFALNSFVDREDFSGDDTDDRDNTAYTASSRVTFRPTSKIALFAAPQVTFDDFDEAVAADGEDRDGYLVTGLIGADYRPRPHLTMTGSIGYSQAFFDDPDRDETGSIIGSGNLSLILDARTDIELRASREVGFTTVDDSSAETSTSAAAKLTRMLTAKTALSTELLYTHTDFNDLDRIDNDVAARVDYFYSLSSNWFLNFGYQYLRRLSDDDQEDFYENRALASVLIVY